MSGEPLKDEIAPPLEAKAASGLDSRSAVSGAEKAPRTVKPKKKKARIKLHIAHHTPGRVRMKIPSAKGDPEALRQVADAFGVLPGVERVSVNVTTGSVVLHYDEDVRDFHNRLHHSLRGVNGPPPTEIDNLANRIEEEAKFLAEHSHTAKVAVQMFSRLDREIKSATNNNVDLKIVLAVGVVALTVLELGAGAATPVWLTLTVFSLNHFVELHQPQRRAVPVLAPVHYKTPRAPAQG